MTTRRGTLLPEITVVAAIVAVIGAVASAERSRLPRLAATPACTAECPPGTRRAEFSTSTVGEALRGGTFHYFQGVCEAVCAPIEECLPPNIPVVTAERFRCDAVPGFSDLPAAADVDLSFGALWDPERAAP